MAKREREDEVAGYLHAVSPIKISKSNNSYFVGKLQTDTNVFKKMVCFDQSKHSSFHEATAAKTPIKICNVRKVQSREDSAKVDVLVNAKSQMHVVRSLTFQHHADDNVDDENKSLADILHIPEKNKVSVSVKVLEVEKDTVVDVRGTLMQKQDILIADSTATMKLSLWDNLVNTLEPLKSYKIENTSTRFFNNVKFLTSTKETTAEQIEPIENVAPAPIKKENQKLTGNITQVNINKNITCGNCRKKATVDQTTLMFRCNFCAMKQKVTSTITTLHGNLNIKSDDRAEKLTIFHAQLTAFIVGQNLEDLKNDTERLEEFFLNKESFEVSFDDDKIIQSIQLA